MSYSFVLTDKAKKSLNKLEVSTQRIIVKWIRKNIIDVDNPRSHGKPLTGTLGNYWRYRVGDYRIIVEIKDDIATIIAVNIGHRRDIYK